MTTWDNLYSKYHSIQVQKEKNERYKIWPIPWYHTSQFNQYSHHVHWLEIDITQNFFIHIFWEIQEEHQNIHEHYHHMIISLSYTQPRIIQYPYPLIHDHLSMTYTNTFIPYHMTHLQDHHNYHNDHYWQNIHLSLVPHPLFISIPRLIPIQSIYWI